MRDKFIGWLCRSSRRAVFIFGFAYATISNGLTGGAAATEVTWSGAIQAGVMSNGRMVEAVDPTQLRFSDNYLLGAIVAVDKRLGGSRFSIGTELQIAGHYGDQRFYEIAVPVALRYHPERSWWNAFDSFAFGLGYSHYSELSQVELDFYEGTSRRNLIYWYAEIEFTELSPGNNLYVRLHHRSNGYDTIEPDGGSNVWVLGYRHEF